MRGMRTAGLRGALDAMGTVIAVAVLLLAASLPSAWGQNAAQRAALARMGMARTQTSAPGNTESTSIDLDLPSGLAFDANGDLFIADSNNNVVREVGVNGAVYTVAGTGVEGFGGDGGAATSALLDTPKGIAVDASGNLYIADSHNQRIREVINGTISTIAGTGTAGFSGDGGAATAAQLSLPLAVAVDSQGNVYIADTDNFRIREIVGGTIGTVAGDGVQGYSGDGGPATAAALDSPRGIAVDAAFNLYIGDTQNQRVRMVTHATGIISTLAGTGAFGFTSDGTALNAQLARPTGVAVDGSGTVYVADGDNNRIRTIAGGTIATIAGNGSQGFNGDTGMANSASLDTPQGVAIEGTSVAVSDTNNQLVREVSSGTIDSTSGQPTQGSETLTVTGPLSTVYGTGTLLATLVNGSNVGTGQVTFLDGIAPNPAIAGTASLVQNVAALNTNLLSAGLHDIVASYAGDAKDAAIASGAYVLTVTQAPAVATANTVNLLYGQAIPALTGTLTGVLAQDSGKVAASFATAAKLGSAPGTYNIAATLTGSAAGNYSVSLSSTSGSVAISKAPTATTLALSSQQIVYGAAETLTATVASTTTGTPTGTVSFYSGQTLLNATPVALSGGVATLSLSTLPIAANLSLTAAYSGDADFVPSTSAAVGTTVISHDFTIAATPSTQSVLPRNSTEFQIALTPVNPTFVYPVTLSATGLPAGVTASFSPATIAAGAGPATSAMTLQASALASRQKPAPPVGGMAATSVLALLMLPLAFSRRARTAAQRLSRGARMAIALLALAALGTLAGCGGGGYFNLAPQSYTVTVTATDGPDTHSTNVTLTVQ